MKAPISVCVGTYGSDDWRNLAAKRAVPSVEQQTLPPADLQVVHGANLHEARNQAAAQAGGEWLCFLDADDELEPRYLEAMTQVIEQDGPPKRLLQPATLGVYSTGCTDCEPVLHDPKDLHVQNYLIIATVVRRDQFLHVGGFADLISHEDWDLWVRCWLDGAVVQPVPNAIYRVHVRSNGRNSAGAAPHVKVINEIRAKYRGRYPESQNNPKAT
jgi:glycosyltransferase involved in cell wall biosynthesis